MSGIIIIIISFIISYYYLMNKKQLIIIIIIIMDLIITPFHSLYKPVKYCDDLNRERERERERYRRDGGSLPFKVIRIKREYCF